MDYPAAFCLFDGINTEDKHVDKGLYYKLDVLSGETSAGWTFVNNGVSWLDEKFDIDIVVDSMDNDDS